jgi:hypothetical protein
MTSRFVNRTIHLYKVLSRDTIMRFFGLEFLHHLSLYRSYMSQVEESLVAITVVLACKKMRDERMER